MPAARFPVVVCSPDLRTVRAVIQGLGSGPVVWTYVGESARQPSLLAPWFGTESRREDCGPLVQAAAGELREAYIDYVGQLNQSNQDPTWRRSCVAEKNPYVSSLFLHVCCIRVAERLGSIAGGPLVLVVEDTGLRVEMARHLGVRCEQPFASARLVWLRGLLEVAARQAYFTISSIAKVLYARHWLRLHKMPAIRKAIAERWPLYVVHTWVDRRAYDPVTGEFHDSDFEQVVAYLEALGRHGFTVPTILRSASYRRVVRYIAAGNTRHLVPHAFTTIVDVARAAAKALWSWPRRRDYPLFAGINMRELIQNDLWRDWFWQRQAPNVLLERLVRRWKSQGLRIERFIYTFENHIWERVICDAFRIWYPEAKLIGHQPNGLPLFQMNYFISPVERSLLALPDLIVTNGIYSTEVLKRSGYDPDRIVCGGGLRQSYLQPWLYGNIGYHPRQADGLRRVLVTPPIGREQTIELISKCVTALADAPGLRVTVKCHPSMPFTRIQRELAGLCELSKFEVSTLTLRELLIDVDILVYSDDTFPCVEALAAGVPVVHLEPACRVPLDSLDGFQDIRPKARTTTQIRQVVGDLLNMSEDDLARSRELWCHTARRLIGPVDTKTFALFAQ